VYMVRRVERERMLRWRWALLEGERVVASGTAWTMGGAHAQLERAVDSELAAA
jgi:hypothetical protein